MKYPVCVLTAHHCSPEYLGLSLEPELLKRAILTAIDMGFKFISYQEFKDIFFGRKTADKKSILLTFDDGYYDFYRYAFPVLKEFKVPAVCFLITDKINDFKRDEFNFKSKKHKDIDYKNDDDQFLNIDEIGLMYASGLVEFDSHTATHFSCKSDNTELIEQELMLSYKKISELFPQKKEFGFCWPKGHFNDIALKAISDLGIYDFAFSTIDGGYDGDDKFKIRRIDISESTKDMDKYICRLKKKLRLYSMPFLGSFYSNFRNKKFK